MKNYIIVAIILFGGMYYFYSDSAKDTNSSNKLGKNANQEEFIRKKKIDTRKKVGIAKRRVSNNNILFDLLKPPDNENFDTVWLDEYGCFGTNNVSGENEQVDIEEFNVPQEYCKYDFLNAKSYKEALWMKNNGYPTKSMIDLVNNPEFKDQLAELVNKKYPVALAVASIQAMENGNFKEASSLALSNRAYSNKSKTYPHVLYGEALLADNMRIAAVSQFFVAGILGDPMANGRALQLSPDKYYTASALSNAQNYLKNLFGLDVPNDPRPIGDEGD